MASEKTSSWQSIAARKQAERIARIPSEWRLTNMPPEDQLNVMDVPAKCGLLTPTELRITEMLDATALVQELRSGKVKSLDVARAFCKRAAVAQQVVRAQLHVEAPKVDKISQTNCLTEIFFEDALRRAEQLDAEFARTGRPTGPLHGLPISLKDTFKVRGYDATAGVAALCFKPAIANSTLVDLLLQAGAVLYCKTNVPLTLMALDSHNNVFGRTLNPADRRLTAGGSSGGEGTLVAFRGSILGVGTDVGGSIRIPAMIHGLYGLKPSHGRVPYAGQESGGSKPGAEQMSIRPSAGPLAHSMRDCSLLMQAISDLKAWEWDPEVVPLLWSPPAPRQRPFRIGVVRSDGVARPLPVIDQFLSETAKRLAQSGQVEIVEVNIAPLLSRCQSLINKIFSVDGGNTMFDLLEETGEPLSPWLKPRLRRRQRMSHEAVRDLHAQRNAMQTEFLKVWTAKGGYWAQSSSSPDDRLDALIAPVAPHPVPEIDRWNTASYTASFVLLECSSGTFPVRKVVDADLTGEIDTSQKPLSGWDKYNRTLWTDVDRKVYLGTPLCLQIIAPRLHDEKIVEAMGVFDAALNKEMNSKAGDNARL